MDNRANPATVLGAYSKIVIMTDWGGGPSKAEAQTYFLDDLDGAKTLGIEDYQLIKFSSYPNPTQDSWTVKTKDQIINTVQVFDVLGKEVITMKPNKSDVKIEASTLPRGLYFAKLTTDLGSNSVKLIKN